MRTVSNHVKKTDLVESMEIRTGKGWDRFDDGDKEKAVNTAIDPGVRFRLLMELE